MDKNKSSKKRIKDNAKEVTGKIIENSVEVVKTGIFSIINGIILKILMGVALIVLITAGGCIGTTAAIENIKVAFNEEH